MSAEEYPLIALTETTRAYVAEVAADEKQRNVEPPRTIPSGLGERLHSLPTFQVRPNWRKLRRSLRRINCFRSEEEEVLVEVPRHKSIDIGVGLARRMSLFIFTRKTVCTHPYHPFTPSQTTRKIFFLHDDKKHPQ
ncbi:uncharacterized protein LOC121725283 [Aricia agestis]|uniref:uncharacterized protein LOC121725283 n=1 Tax=Aricia agestis TaxID=91739 RepID=UPI001C205DE3|nr:uncharacterized protein LOC121725283 [Aricia agestis]